MKKLLPLALLMYLTSCSNPEDQATGNPDSTSFNQSGNDKNLNTASDRPGNQSHVNNNDTSNTSSPNRSYMPGGDSTKK